MFVVREHDEEINADGVAGNVAEEEDARHEKQHLRHLHLKTIVRRVGIDRRRIVRRRVVVTSGGAVQTLRRRSGSIDAVELGEGVGDANVADGDD